MSLDVPLGDLQWGEEAWDAARVRRREELVARQGRTVLGAGTVAPDGEMVAFTEVAVADESPERVHQWETFVTATHRGRRLGTLVKTAVLRRLADELPQARTMSTCNAGTNAPMVAVNEVLGFRPNGLLVAFQKGLSDRAEVRDAADVRGDVGLVRAARAELDEVHGEQHQRAAEHQPQT
jgi:RimJ/RimL family protein N-acetyltransferase